MIQKLQVLRDINNVPTGGLHFPVDNTYTYNTTLAVDTAQSLTVPANANRAIFSFTPLGCWVSLNQGSIALPGSSFAATAAVKDPIDREVVPGQTLYFISANVTEVGVEFLTTENYP